MSSAARTRGVLALIFLLTLATRFAYYAPDPIPTTGPWVNGAMAHNIVSDGRWFQVNANAGPNFSFIALTPHVGHLVAPDEANLVYADAHPRWEPFIWEPVGEAALLAGVWEIVGTQSYAADVVMKIVLDAFAALLVYRIAMRLFKRQRAALAAGLLYALYLPIAAIVINPSRDFWSLFFTIAVLAVYLETINSRRPTRWLVALGLVTGVGLYFDPGALLLPGALALTSIGATGWRTALCRALVPTAIAALLTIPWTIRNYNDFHTFVPIRTGLGTALWQGLAELPNPYGPTRTDYATYELARGVRPPIRWQTPASDAYLESRALAVIEHHPLFYLKTVAHRVWITTLGEVDLEWASRRTTTPFAYARGPIAYAIERPSQFLQVMLVPLVFLLAMVSLGCTWLRYKSAHLPLIAMALAVGVPYILVNAEPRYTMPMSIAYLIWIGLGADLLLARIGVRREARGRLAPRGASRWA
jgi:4-amino-4-deoxy-L-arabinose transferase-like glycosyltransferase